MLRAIQRQVRAVEPANLPLVDEYDQDGELTGNQVTATPHDLEQMGIYILADHPDGRIIILCSGHEGDPWPEGEILSEGKPEERYMLLSEDVKYRVLRSRVFRATGLRQQVIDHINTPIPNRPNIPGGPGNAPVGGGFSNLPELPELPEQAKAQALNFLRAKIAPPDDSEGNPTPPEAQYLVIPMDEVSETDDVVETDEIWPIRIFGERARR